MIVCLCARVSDRQIREAAADGARSLDCLQKGLGVATRCRRCADCAASILCEVRQAASAADGALDTPARTDARRSVPIQALTDRRTRSAA